tara:strand:+ start:20425 stop:20757 length:333 start_codon:yes stop_codon:yes gene_type:complete
MVNWYKIAQVELVFEHIHEDFHSGQHNYVMSAKEAITLQLVGMVEYSIYEEEVYVNDMLVKQDLRRQGIGTQMINELKREYPEGRINWGMKTPDGSALYESMENPTNELV